MIASLVLLIINISCKKLDQGQKLCGCSPVTAPEFRLVLKNSSGEDLLSDKVTGAYSRDKIAVFYKDGDGKEVKRPFSLHEPFSYGNQKFEMNTLGIHIISADPIYLRLGEGKVYKISFKVSETSSRLEDFMIDDTVAEMAAGEITKYLSIYYLTVVPVTPALT